MLRSKINDQVSSLPPLDSTVIEIQDVCRSGSSSLSDLTKIIERDPVLTANILKLANSPLYGFSKEISSVGRAVSLFGMATIRSFCMSNAISKNLKTDLSPYGIDENKFLKISTTQNSLMFHWYNRIAPSDLSILSSASFMLEVGKIVVSAELAKDPELCGEFKSKFLQTVSPEELSQLEMELFGISNEEVAANIFEKWGLEDALVSAIFYSEQVEKAPSYLYHYSKALNVVKNAVSVYGILDQVSIDRAMYLCDNISGDKLLVAIDKVKNGI